MLIRTNFPEGATLAQRLFYSFLRNLTYFWLEWLPYAPIRRFNKPNLSGSFVWASSHSNFLCDCVPAGSEAERPTKFLAKSTLFRFPIKGIIEFCGALPITRPEDLRNGGAVAGEARASRNHATFKAAVSAMEQGWPVAIFPEGTCLVKPGLILPLKPGVAKLAFAAEEANNFQLGTRVVPVGLEYVSRLRVGSGLNIRYGKPILVKDYQARYEQGKEDAYRAFMADLTREMVSAFPHFQDEAKHVLGRKLVAVGMARYRFDVAQLFLRLENHPTFWAGLGARMEAFEEANREHRIPLAAWGHREIWRALGAEGRRKRAAFLVGWAPLALVDLVLNTAPEFALSLAVERMAVDDTEKMTLRFGLAPAVLPIAFLLQFWLVRALAWSDLPTVWFLPYFFGLPFLWYGTNHWKKQFKRAVSLFFFRGVNGKSEVVRLHHELRQYLGEFQDHGRQGSQGR